MPRIDERTIDGVAQLARLRLTPEERARYARELEAILTWAESLQAIDTSGVPPHSAAAAVELREDVPQECLPREQALGSAPDPADGLFRVPRILPG
jgi:aspartyl-tRNA(Asn)/glutamyl-tRNA(Gln) amidotransferase subunit C